VIDKPIVVEMVDARVVRPLRRAVLRPHQPVEQSQYPADDDPRSAHGAVRLPPHDHAGRGEVARSDVVAVGSVLPEPPPWEPTRLDGWRIRGMATDEPARRRGFGGAILDALASHVARHGGGLVWCNARTPAQGLYARAGFVARGEVFDIPGIGPHVHMFRTIAVDHPPTDATAPTDERGTGEPPSTD
jgi:GNAT superfamily N-acetyltransferase